MQLESGSFRDVRIGAKPTRRSWLLVATILVATVCGFLILAARSRTLATATFPDGSRVSVAAVTNGSVHTFDGRTLGERILGHIGPLRALGRQNLFTYRPERPGEVLWLRLDRRYPALMESVGATYQDEHGCVYPGNPLVPMASVSGAPTFYAVQPPSLSPSAKRLIVEVHRGGTIARLKMNAASQASRSRFTPRELPVSFESSGLITTLRRLSKKHAWGTNYAAMQLDYRTGERPITAFSPMRIEITDTGGNNMASMVYPLPKDPADPHNLPMPGDPHIEWGFLAPCRREPAWKMRLYSVANDWETRRPDRSWRLTLPRYSSKAPATVATDGIKLVVRAGQHWGSAPGKVERDEYLFKLHGATAGCRLFLSQIDGQKVRDYFPKETTPRRERAVPTTIVDLHAGNAWTGRLSIPIIHGKKPISVRVDGFDWRAAEFIVEPRREFRAAAH